MLSRYTIARFLLSIRMRIYAPCTRPFVSVGLDLVYASQVACEQTWPGKNRQERYIDMAQITMSEMLKAGLHFGHQTRRWNPKMKQFILTQRNGIHIINLFKSLDMIDKAYDFIKQTVAHNGTVLFVGTKKQAQEAVQNQATRVNMPYVSERWLGGMLTNFQTVSTLSLIHI